MPYVVSSPPERIKMLPKHAQRIWISAYNSAYKQYNKDEEKANKVAWNAVKRLYRKNRDGKWVKKTTSFSFTINLSGAEIKKEMEIHIIPVGEWEHIKYGKMKITKEDIADFIENFDKNIRKGVYITEGHDNGMGNGELPAIGWFKKLINKEEKGLWGIVEWTEKGRQLLKDKAYKYFSPEYNSVYEDPETHKLYNNVLVGGALTNSPYFKGLKSIVMSESLILDQFENDNIMTKKQDKKDLSETENDEETEEENEEDNETEEEKTELNDEEETEEEEEKKGETEKEEKTKLSETKEVVYRNKKDLSEDMKSKEQKIVYQVMSSGGIQLEKKKNLSEFKKELLRTGIWQHSAGKEGMLKITKETLSKIVSNFKKKVLDNVMVPLGHPTTDNPSSNVGEVKKLEVSKDGEKLMATIDVKDKTISGKIKDGLIKGISASIAENYIKKDTGETVGPVMFHAALVTEPYIKQMGGFVPLSEEFKDSKIIAIRNEEQPLTLNDIYEKIDSRLEKIEKKLNLEDEENTETEEKKEEKVEEAEVKESKEEVVEDENKKEEKKEEEVSTEKETENVKDETSEEDDSTKDLSEESSTETESSKVSEKAKEEEKETDEESKEKSEEEKTDTEEEKTEEAKEEVTLAEAEKEFGTLLSEGKVTPAEKEFLIPLMISNSEIELSEGNKISSGKALIEYLKKRKSLFSLSEDGTSESGNGKSQEIPAEIKQQLSEMQFSEEDQPKIYEEFKKSKEEGKELTSF